MNLEPSESCFFYTATNVGRGNGDFRGDAVFAVGAIRAIIATLKILSNNVLWKRNRKAKRSASLLTSLAGFIDD